MHYASEVTSYHVLRSVYYDTISRADHILVFHLPTTLSTLSSPPFSPSITPFIFHSRLKTHLFLKSFVNVDNICNRRCSLIKLTCAVQQYQLLATNIQDGSIKTAPLDYTKCTLHSFYIDSALLCSL